MTRDGFFDDLTTMLRLLAQLGVPGVSEGCPLVSSAAAFGLE